MNIRLRKIQGDGDFVESYIKRLADEHNVDIKINRRGMTINITIDGNYPFNLDDDFRHPGFIRDSRIESILDFLDEDFDDDSEEDKE